MVFVFGFPVNTENPPPAAVVQKLKAIDASSKGLFALGVTRLVRAPDVGHVVPDFDAVGNGSLKEALGRESAFAAGDVVLRAEDSCRHDALVVAITGNQAGARIEQRAETVPIAGGAGGAGDHVIDRGKDVIDRVHIAGAGWRRHRRRRRRTGGNGRRSWSLRVGGLGGAGAPPAKKAQYQ